MVRTTRALPHRSRVTAIEGAQRATTRTCRRQTATTRLHVRCTDDIKSWCKRRHANEQLCSITAECTPATAHSVQHEPRELLPTVCDRAAERRIQQRPTVAANVNKSQPPATASDRARTRAAVREEHCQHSGLEAQDQYATSVPPCESRGWLYQRESRIGSWRFPTLIFNLIASPSAHMPPAYNLQAMQ